MPDALLPEGQRDIALLLESGWLATKKWRTALLDNRDRLSAEFRTINSLTEYVNTAGIEFDDFVEVLTGVDPSEGETLTTAGKQRFEQALKGLRALPLALEELDKLLASAQVSRAHMPLHAAFQFCPVG